MDKVTTTAASPAPKKERMLSIDFMRIFSCICIIMLHESGHLVWGSRYSLLIQAIVRPSLWSFAMISGYFVLNRPIKSIRKFYLKNTVHIIIPLFIYSVFYQLYANIDSIVDLRSALNVISLKSILAGDIYGHMWFVYTLVGVYLAAPFLQILLTKLTKDRLLGLLAICFFFTAVVPILTQLGLGIGFEFPLAGTLLFFFLLGYALKQFDPNRYRIPIFILGIINIPLICLTALNPYLAPSMFTCSINMLIGVVFYFTLFSQFRFQAPRWLSKITLFVSKRTYGIYLIHIMVMQVLANNYFTYTPANKFYLPIFLTLLNFFISFLIATVVDLLLVTPILWVYDRVISLLGKAVSRMLPAD